MTIIDLANTYHQPLSIEAAVSLLGDKAADTVLIGGATWVMRAPLRDQHTDRFFVSLAKIPELHRVSANATHLELGALVTHQGLAAATTALPEMAALAQAAAHSANPAIRRLATVGGNICTQGFAAADLVPACVALAATVDVQSGAGTATLSVEDYIPSRGSRPSDEILTRVCIPRQSGKSAHARGLLRRAGEYPVANVSLYMEAGADGMIEVIRIAVGAVETSVKRWHALERVLKGQHLATASVADLAETLMTDMTPRDAIDAPGWYRLRILPQLVERAFSDVVAQIEGVS